MMIFLYAQFVGTLPTRRSIRCYNWLALFRDEIPRLLLIKTLHGHYSAKFAAGAGEVRNDVAH